MMDALVVGVIVVAASVYAAVKFLPAALVNSWRRRLAQGARRAGVPALARSLETKVADAGCGSGCATCGSCADNTQETRVVHAVDVSALERGGRR
jgi:hypothetical protein